MGYGFQLLSAHGRVQIDQDFKAPRLIASGSSIGGVLKRAEIAMPYDIDAEPPIVLVRPSLADSYVGAFFCGRDSAWTTFNGMANGGIALYGQCAFDYAIFSTMGSAVSDGSAFGIEVYRADGSTAFTSRHRHPRLRALFQKPASSAADGGYPNTFSISGFASMPWLLANPLLASAFGVGPDSSHMGAVMGAVNSSFTQLTVSLRDFGDPTLPALTAADVSPSVADYDPYSGLPAWFAVATHE